MVKKLWLKVLSLSVEMWMYIKVNNKQVDCGDRDHPPCIEYTTSVDVNYPSDQPHLSELCQNICLGDF